MTISSKDGGGHHGDHHEHDRAFGGLRSSSSCHHHRRYRHPAAPPSSSLSIQKAIHSRDHLAHDQDYPNAIIINISIVTGHCRRPCRRLYHPT